MNYVSFTHLQAIQFRITYVSFIHSQTTQFRIPYVSSIHLQAAQFRITYISFIYLQATQFCLTFLPEIKNGSWSCNTTEKIKVGEQCEIKCDAGKSLGQHC